jgi:hypothetical protein
VGTIFYGRNLTLPLAILQPSMNLTLVIMPSPEKSALLRTSATLL